jgi:hypothetical protein
MSEDSFFCEFIKLRDEISDLKSELREFTSSSPRG